MKILIHSIQLFAVMRVISIKKSDLMSGFFAPGFN